MDAVKLFEVFLSNIFTISFLSVAGWFAKRWFIKLDSRFTDFELHIRDTSKKIGMIETRIAVHEERAKDLFHVAESFRMLTEDLILAKSKIKAAFRHIDDQAKSIEKLIADNNRLMVEIQSIKVRVSLEK